MGEKPEGAHMRMPLSKPAHRAARYAEEYKKEALELWRSSGRSAAKVAAELGIRAPFLCLWNGTSADSERPVAAKFFLTIRYKAVTRLGNWLVSCWTF
jgi:hypothetical protein